MLYIKNNVIAEKVFKEENKEEAIRVKNYSFVALEEFISNAIYHRTYQIHEPITIRIEKRQIEITSFPGPDRSISDLASIKNNNSPLPILLTDEERSFFSVILPINEAFKEKRSNDNNKKINKIRKK